MYQHFQQFYLDLFGVPGPCPTAQPGGGGERELHHEQKMPYKVNCNSTISIFFMATKTKFSTVHHSMCQCLITFVSPITKLNFITFIFFPFCKKPKEPSIKIFLKKTTKVKRILQNLFQGDCILRQGGSYR